MAFSWKNLTKKQKAQTEPWMRNKADELAVNNGCWFDPLRAAYMIWWVERYCKLYEGEGFAGEPVIMPSIVEQPHEWNEIPNLYPEFWNEDGTPRQDVMAFYSARLDWHNELFHAGHFMHWQFECHARIYGWQRRAEERWYKRGLLQVRRFRTANVWIPKKSGKTPSLGFNTLYLTFGDGEPGAKTFIAAKDGTQAARVWDHSYRMLEASPELKASVKTNLTTKRVSHLTTYSHFEPLSSSNVNTTKSKEGLNGNTVVDETHVVDRDYMRILKFAGVSRPQAIELKFSTAGDDPESYGKEEWDKGEAVNAGELDIDNYFHQSYHAPQGVTVSEVKRNPEKYIRMSNPALGHTVGLDELISSFKESSQSPADFASYAMYRLNVWQHAAKGWLSPEVWKQCGGHKFDKHDLSERQCVLGLDLARKFDLAACVPAWLNESGGVDIPFPMFWCNEDRINDIAVKHPKILQWVEAGLIRVNPGNVTNLSNIKRDIREFCNKNKVVGIVYDATYAEQLIQNLTEGEHGPDGEYVYEPLQIGEQAISQGMLTQTGPVADFENDLKRSVIGHDDNDVLTWQFGHATVKEDARGHRLIQKENRKSYRTVDGCQAAVMARWGALDFTGWEIRDLNFYAKNDVEYV